MRKTIFAIALMSAMSAMAQKHAEVDVHARYTKVVTPVNGKYESKRPPVAERLFTSEAVEEENQGSTETPQEESETRLDVRQLLSEHAGKYGALSPVG